MKIGLLTLTPSENYGGILQCVALYAYLESQGHEVILINKKHSFPKWKKMLFNVLKFIPFQNIKNIRKTYYKSESLQPFITKNITKISREVVTSSDLKEIVKEQAFDAVIVGSDQVWRYQYINDGNHSVYFLDFKTDFPVKKIAYAASFGKDVWEEREEVINVSKWLKDFSAISVREKSAVNLCRNVFGIDDCEFVIDPTILIGAEFYNKFFLGLNNVEQGKKLVTYVLDKGEDIKNTISSIKTGLEKKHDEIYSQLNLSDEKDGKFFSVEGWLWQIKNADFVVTDSFHGMVFSIIFKKQFIVLGNEQRGLSRFESLLSEIGLEHRLNINDQSYDEIFYEPISRKIDFLIDNSKNYLSRSLVI